MRGGQSGTLPTRTGHEASVAACDWRVACALVSSWPTLPRAALHSSAWTWLEPGTPPPCHQSCPRGHRLQETRLKHNCPFLPVFPSHVLPQEAVVGPRPTRTRLKQLSQACPGQLSPRIPTRKSSTEPGATLAGPPRAAEMGMFGKQPQLRGPEGTWGLHGSWVERECLGETEEPCEDSHP
jgi:hypothetical protein